MNEIKLTCPFTGHEFNAMLDEYGNMYFTHPITRKNYQMRFDTESQKLLIDRKLFEHMETCTQRQACEILELSRQRVNKIAHDEVIPSFNVNGTSVFLMRDVIRYKETRKIGKPTKER